jgi:competence ComEA-like helix-hairpin-helix protein
MRNKKIIYPCAILTALMLGFLIGYSIFETVPSDGFIITGERETGISAAVYSVPEAGRIDINTAPAMELADLPGIGPALSRRIVEYREEHGPFESVGGLLDVHGIGESVLERLEPFATVGGAE